MFGTIDGKLHLSENIDARKLYFAPPKTIELEDSRQHLCDAAPCVSDWDLDGRLDLLVGGEDGSVHWFKNTGTSAAPSFSPGIPLIPASPIGWGSDQDRNAGDWGLRVRPFVTDWNNDRLPDLLIGDYCGGFEAKPDQFQGERSEEMRSLQALPILQSKWSEAFKKYRAALRISSQAGKNASNKTSETKQHLLAEIASLKTQIVVAQATIQKYKPQRQTHGFVWLFERKSP